MGETQTRKEMTTKLEQEKEKLEHKNEKLEQEIEKLAKQLETAPDQEKPAIQQQMAARKQQVATMQQQLAEIQKMTLELFAPVTNPAHAVTLDTILEMVHRAYVRGRHDRTPSAHDTESEQQEAADEQAELMMSCSPAEFSKTEGQDARKRRRLENRAEVYDQRGKHVAHAIVEETAGSNAGVAAAKLQHLSK
eukprot:TRINITY_DN548_c0_g1_i2.p1 TRINITY_DN548_c0_g1~~TRINITY_DN548_c0_g1_i2.p1  ORF type:complete len:208 (-),score=50.78 TRINITY_DN548_c0_g1_i2:102-680(-)